MSEIGKAVRELDRERRNKMKELMDEWDNTYYYPKMKELRSRCNHNLKFVGLNPINWPIFTCTICGHTQIEKQDSCDRDESVDEANAER